MSSYPTHFQATGVNKIGRRHGTFRYFYLAGVKHYIIAPGYTLSLCVSECLNAQLTILVCSSVCL